MRYEDAVESLFQAPHEQFVTERKRLAGELKVAGDKDGAARLGKLARPPISAWVVDQLWWRERGAFEALFDTAEGIRRGDPSATAAHREALARLRGHAVRILGDAEHAASEATLRRVTQTLSALAAAGGWAPDAPGALSADRDPPGFEAIGIGAIPFPAQPAPAMAPAARLAAKSDAAEPAAQAVELDAARARRDARETREARDARDAREARDADEARVRREREAAAARAEAAAEMRRAEAERARAAAERNRLEAALRTARGDVAQREREVVKLERDLAYARTLVTQARDVVTGLEERLAQLDN